MALFPYTFSNSDEFTYQNTACNTYDFLGQGIFGQNKSLDIGQVYKTNSAFINFSQTPLII